MTNKTVNWTRYPIDPGLPNGKTNDQSDLTWGASYTLMGYLAMYRATHNHDLIRAFVRQADAIIEQRDDHAQRYQKMPVWSSLNYTKNVPYAHVTATGMITYPLVDFAIVVHNDPRLPSLRIGGRDCSTIAARYVTSAKEAIAAHDYQLQAHGDLLNADGVYHALPETEDFYKDDAGRPISNAPALPFNYQCAMGRAIVSIARHTRESGFVTRAETLGIYFRKSLQKKDNGTYVWKYWDWDEDPNIEDYSHGIICADFARLCYSARLVFDRNDIDLLTHTFTRNIKKNWDGYALKVDGSGSVPTPEKTDMGLWQVLGSYNPYIYDYVSELYSGTPESDAKSWLYFVISLLALHAPR